MAIVVLDDLCSMSCEYCFYGSHLWKVREKLIEQWKISKDEVYFPKEKIQKVIQKLKDSSFSVSLWWKSIVITWWEPTIHPDFIQIMQTFLKEWFIVHLLSNFSFQPDWEIAKFLKKNISKFRFLINLNETDKQPLSKNTIQNLINLDDDKIKISINLYHTNYNWSYLQEVLSKTKNIHIIRLWLPNPEVSEWIAKWIMKEFLEKYQDKFDKTKYEKDLFEDDLANLENSIYFPYGQKDPVVKEYYNLLTKEIRKLIDFIENKLPTERKNQIQFYLDCGFDVSLFDDDVYGYLFKRLYYKNTCSIPNMDVNLAWSIKQCYTISNFWDFENKLNIDNVSFSQAKWFYKISSLFFTKGLLRNEDKEQACTAYHLRFYYQLWGDLEKTWWKLSIGTDPTKTIKTAIRKDYEKVLETYFKKYTETKNNNYLVRILQFIEFNFTLHNFDIIEKVIRKYAPRIRKNDEQLDFHFHYYQLMISYIKELSKNLSDIVWIKEKYKANLEKLRWRFNQMYQTLPKENIKNLDFITEQIVSSFSLI